MTVFLRRTFTLWPVFFFFIVIMFMLCIFHGHCVVLYHLLVSPMVVTAFFKEMRIHQNSLVLEVLSGRMYAFTVAVREATEAGSV